jgi:acetyl-CoA acyltransferase
MEIRTVGIVDFARSPISKKLLDRNPKVPREKIEAVCAGCAFPEGENGLNIGRAISVKAGLPIEVAGMTVNHFCASSQQSTMMLADAIAVGKGDAALSVGLEHMKRVPMGGFNPTYDKELHDKEFYITMGATAEILAKEGPISRVDQEEFSIRSHRNALKAWADGAFAAEVVPIELADGTQLTKDECPMEPNIGKIKTLAPAFDAEGTVTAATSSPVTTGAGAIILMSADLASKLGIPLRATIVSTAYAGCDYRRMGLGPLPATEKALARAGLKLSDIDVIELNEAFASQALCVIRNGKWPIEKINLLGGAIALGHPLGMSGVRVIGQAITTLERVKGEYAIATMCVGGGQGATTILRREGK